MKLRTPWKQVGSHSKKVAQVLVPPLISPLYSILYTCRVVSRDSRHHCQSGCNLGFGCFFVIRSKNPKHIKLKLYETTFEHHQLFWWKSFFQVRFWFTPETGSSPNRIWRWPTSRSWRGSRSKASRGLLTPNCVRVHPLRTLGMVILPWKQRSI